MLVSFLGTHQKARGKVCSRIENFGELRFLAGYRVLFKLFEDLRWMAVYKSGTGTRGRGLRDACVGTWDLGTRDEGLEDIKYGTRGDVKNREVGDAGCE